MYYRLTHIDEEPIPCVCKIGPVVHKVAKAGLLLEPPDSSLISDNQDLAGYSILRFLRAQDDELAGASLEPYRWSAPGVIEIGRIPPGGEARFLGLVDGSTLELTAQGDSDFLRVGMRLRFVAAPEDPIPDDWRNILYFGPPIVQLAEGQPEPDEATFEVIRQSISEEDREGKLRAVTRLENAWRTPALAPAWSCGAFCICNCLAGRWVETPQTKCQIECQNPLTAADAGN